MAALWVTSVAEDATRMQTGVRSGLCAALLSGTAPLAAITWSRPALADCSPETDAVSCTGTPTNFAPATQTNLDVTVQAAATAIGTGGNAAFTVDDARAAIDLARLDAGAKLPVLLGKSVFANFTGGWSGRGRRCARQAVSGPLSSGGKQIGCCSRPCKPKLHEPHPGSGRQDR